MLAPPSLGATARASEVAIRATPNSTVLRIPSINPMIFRSTWKVTTLAGNGTQSFVNGTGTGATFNGPRGIVVLANGNLAVLDSVNSAIRLVTYPGGVVTTLAGSGTPAYADGTGAGASFSFPGGIALLPDGNIVVADTENHRIRIVTPAGVVTTLAGSGTPAFANGTGAGASFWYPYGVAVLLDGNIAVVDQVNNRIRLVTYPGGVVTTLAGSSYGYLDGTGTGAQFGQPLAIAVLPNGNIVVADFLNHRIRLVTYPGGVVTTLAGNDATAYVDGTGAGASFKNPSGLGVTPDGNVIVGDSGTHCIRMITPSGVVTTLAGNGTLGFADGTGTDAMFNVPYGTAMLPNGNIVVADYNNRRIRIMTPISVLVS